MGIGRETPTPFCPAAPFWFRARVALRGGLFFSPAVPSNKRTGQPWPAAPRGQASRGRKKKLLKKVGSAPDSGLLGTNRLSVPFLPGFGSLALSLVECGTAPRVPPAERRGDQRDEGEKKIKINRRVKRVNCCWLPTQSGRGMFKVL